MTDLRDLMERADRAAGLVDLPSDGFDRLVSYRNKKRRNQRITSAVVALVIAALGIWGLTRVFNDASEQRKRPVSPINSSNVPRLTLSWKAQVPGVTSSVPVASGGRVFLTENGYVYAFDRSCGATGGSCAPLWRATLEGASLPDFPAVVSGGFVYVGAGTRVYAFSESCGSSGSVCRPSWRSSPLSGTSGIAAVAGGTVIAIRPAVNTLDSTDIFGFRTECGATECAPVWKASVPGLATGGAVRQGLILQSSDSALTVFPASCTPVPGTCRPLWSFPHADGFDFVAADAGNVYALSFVDGSLYAFPPSCGNEGNRCEPTWLANVEAGATNLVTADDMVFVIKWPGAYPASDSAPPGKSETKIDLVAFSASCGANGATCSPAWTAEVVGSATWAENHQFERLSLVHLATDARHVFVASADRNRLLAFPIHCGSSGAVCTPIWTATLPPSGTITSPIVAGDLVYVTDGEGVYAFRTDCGSGGAECRPAWRGSIRGSRRYVAVADGQVYVGVSGGMYAFAFPSGQPSGLVPTAIWSAIGVMLAVAAIRRLKARRVA